MFVDHTLPLGESTMVPPGEVDLGGFSSELIYGQEEGEPAVHQLDFNTHTGTHVDAPLHYIPEGKSIDEIGLDVLVGQTTVVDLRGEQGNMITADMLAERTGGVSPGERLAVLTGDVDRFLVEENDVEGFFREAAGFSEDAGEWLVENEVSLVANDFITEPMKMAEDKPYNPDRPVHQQLLSSEIPIVEYVCNIEPLASRDTVELFAVPLPLTDLDASPARVFSRVS